VGEGLGSARRKSSLLRPDVSQPKKAHTAAATEMVRDRRCISPTAEQPCSSETTTAAAVMAPAKREVPRDCGSRRFKIWQTIPRNAKAPARKSGEDKNPAGGKALGMTATHGHFIAKIGTESITGDSLSRPPPGGYPIRNPCRKRYQVRHMTAGDRPADDTTTAAEGRSYGCLERITLSYSSNVPLARSTSMMPVLY
jgi:hypothetical protein